LPYTFTGLDIYSWIFLKNVFFINFNWLMGYPSTSRRKYIWQVV
jgi:hypothetical protein